MASKRISAYLMGALLGKLNILASPFLNITKILKPLAGLWRDENCGIPESNMCPEGSFENICLIP